MTDAEAEKIGREWAGKRGKVPASHNRGGLKWYWLMDTDVGDGFSDPGVLPDPVYDLIAPNMRDYPTESAAFAALGLAVVRGREVFE